MPVHLVVLPKHVSRPALQFDARAATFLPSTLRLARLYLVLSLLLSKIFPASSQGCSRLSWEVGLARLWQYSKSPFFSRALCFHFYVPLHIQMTLLEDHLSLAHFSPNENLGFVQRRYYHHLLVASNVGHHPHPWHPRSEAE